MSSAATLNFDEGEEVDLAKWEEFANKHELSYAPRVVGQNTYKHATLPIEVFFGADGFCPEPGPNGRIDFEQCRPPKHARRIVISTYWMDSARVDVARLAVAAWHAFGGSLNADPEVMAYIRAFPA